MMMTMRRIKTRKKIKTRKTKRNKKTNLWGSTHRIMDGVEGDGDDGSFDEDGGMTIASEGCAPDEATDGCGDGEETLADNAEELFGDSDVGLERHCETDMRLRPRNRRPGWVYHCNRVWFV